MIELAGDLLRARENQSFEWGIANERFQQFNDSLQVRVHVFIGPALEPRL
jgi:hypothetical protein